MILTISIPLILGQFLAIFVLLTIQDDIIDSIQIVTIFFNRSEEKDRFINGKNMESVKMRSSSLVSDTFENNDSDYWKNTAIHVIFPNFLKVSHVNSLSPTSLRITRQKSQCNMMYLQSFSLLKGC